MTPEISQNTEKERLGLSAKKNPWKTWGPYLSERQWGTVREDYSDTGDAWNHFPHDQSRSRTYRWGEDGIAGISDRKQNLCFAPAFWNGQDPIIKERLFGLTNQEGNHGEDVKECYYYLDNTPTHSYMKYLYKYPQKAYPYLDLIERNKNRTGAENEYELIDTGIFDENRYFDIFIEYAKESPNTILILLTIHNRGPEKASLHVLPTLWFRNTWEWAPESHNPNLSVLSQTVEWQTLSAQCEHLGEYFLSCEGNIPLLFTNNETNNERLFASSNRTQYVKDGINDYLIEGNKDCINPENKGTKASAHYRLEIEAGKSATIKLRLSDQRPSPDQSPFGENFDSLFPQRKKEADIFYETLTSHLDDDAKNVMRQAFSGMLWNKQYYLFTLNKWLHEHKADPFDAHSLFCRNKEWFHMINDHIISVPDKWEYPWYAAWDLAFHTLTYSLVDIEFAKQQLLVMLKEIYQHPNGQIPAYEWNFSEVNPPVHAWATIFINNINKIVHKESDVDFLKRAFSKLLINFTWWVNRKDRFGKNIFEGGFLGLDNIGVFDRSAPLPTGGYLEQADGTAWMAFFCQNMLELSTELAGHDPIYEELTLKFAEHFLWIASAVNKIGEEGMWDETDGFYYDVLRLPNGNSKRLKVRSLVGLLPLCATTIIEPWQRANVPKAMKHLSERALQMPDLIKHIHPTGEGHLGYGERGVIALVNEEKLRKILTIMLDENEFLSEFGIRSLSKYHLDNPYVFDPKEKEYIVKYLPAESDVAMFGGNSNWRGPIWMPINCLIIRALLNFYLYYGDNFKIEFPTGSGNMMNLFQVARNIVQRLSNIFLKDQDGKRPVFGDNEKQQTDPFWKDNLLFYEYFHGDNGSGLGASHQTGWTGLIANMIFLCKTLDEKEFLKGGKEKLNASIAEKPKD